MDERTAVVTGAARGIGRVIACDLLDRGLSVVAVDRSDAVAELAAHHEGDRVRAIVGDIREDDTGQRAIAAASELRGRLAVLVNCAFAEKRGPVLELTNEDWDFTLGATLVGAVSMSRQFARAVRGNAAIVNVSSTHAFAGEVGYAPYDAAKAALLAYTRSLALELGPLGIRCNAVAPGFIRVERNEAIWGNEHVLADMVKAWPLRRPGLPSEVAACVAFLASDEASFVTGTCLPVDGGLLAGLPVGPTGPAYDFLQTAK